MKYRLTHLAQADIVSILAWSEQTFGPLARQRYQRLISAALRDAAGSDELGRVLRADLGDGVFTWHLSRSRTRISATGVARPRHFLICRQNPEVLVVGRVLHDTMDLRRPVNRVSWD